MALLTGDFLWLAMALGFFALKTLRGLGMG